MRWRRGWLIRAEGSEQPQGEKRGWSPFWVVCPGGWGLSRGGRERLLSVLPQSGQEHGEVSDLTLLPLAPCFSPQPPCSVSPFLQVWLETCLLWQLL